MPVAREGKFKKPCGDLRRSEQRADGDHGRGCNSGAVEDRKHMRRKRRRNEHIKRKGAGNENKRQSFCRQMPCFWSFLLRLRQRRRMLARKSESQGGAATSASSPA